MIYVNFRLIVDKVIIENLVFHEIVDHATGMKQATILLVKIDLYEHEQPVN